MVMRISLTTRQWVIVLLALLLMVYIAFQARFLILGPRVSFLYPTDGTVLTENPVTLRGSAYNIAWISLNGRQIFTNQDGIWEEKLLLSPGTSIMTAKVRDRFGREREESIRLIFKQ